MNSFSLFLKKIFILSVLIVCVPFSLAVLSNDIGTEGLNVSEVKANELVDQDVSEPDLNKNPHEFYRFHIEAVLSGDDFGSKETEKAWRLKEKFTDKDKRKEKVPEWLISVIEFFEGFSDVFLNISKVIEVILWIVFVIAIVFLLIKYRKPLSKFVREMGAKKTSTELPSEMFGLDIRQESLPKSIVQSAQTLWDQAEHRQALALLLRATLSHLLHEKECNFDAGDTELDCYHKVQSLEEEDVSTFMHLLINAWLKLAYAHQMPTNEGFARICTQWNEVFNAR